jgi:hypothetical protein
MQHIRTPGLAESILRSIFDLIAAMTCQFWTSLGLLSLKAQYTHEIPLLQSCCLSASKEPTYYKDMSQPTSHAARSSRASIWHWEGGERDLHMPENQWIYTGCSLDYTLDHPGIIHCFQILAQRLQHLKAEPLFILRSKCR